MSRAIATRWGSRTEAIRRAQRAGQYKQLPYVRVVSDGLANLREQFGDLWYALSTLLGHDVPSVTKDVYL